MQFQSLLVLFAFAVSVNGHGQMTVPLPRKDIDGNAVSYRQNEPVYTLNGPGPGYSTTSMRCHDYTFQGQPTTTITAGQSTPITWSTPAGHPGECYLYISYDCNGKTGPCNPVNFFKVAQYPGCGSQKELPASTTINTLIPAELPACDHCVVRWEWTGHQQVSNIEFYTQCADVKIASNAGPTKPTPVVAISGIEHLPQTADGYRRVYDVGPSEGALFGPKLATFAACNPGDAGCLVPNAASGGGGTPATTSAPTTTATTAPTKSAGQTTAAPTKSTGQVTSAPTNAGGSPDISTCGDIGGFVDAVTNAQISCASLANYCLQWEAVYLRCQKTCNACSTECADKSPSGLFFNDGSKADCAAAKPYCSYGFVSRACPQTCGTCGQLPASSDEDLSTPVMVTEEDYAANKVQTLTKSNSSSSNAVGVVVGLMVGLLVVGAIFAYGRKIRRQEEDFSKASKMVAPQSPV